MKLLVLLLFTCAVLITGCAENDPVELELYPDTVEVDLDTIETQ